MARVSMCEAHGVSAGPQRALQDVRARPALPAGGPDGRTALWREAEMDPAEGVQLRARAGESEGRPTEPGGHAGVGGATCKPPATKTACDG